MTLPDIGMLDDQFDEVMEQIRAGMPQAQIELVEPFARSFFAQTDPLEMREIPVADLYGAVLSQWHFARTRTETSKLRVFNPQLDENGWESPHTVIEIVGEDIPFLVDSVTNEVNRQGLGLHLIVHPVMSIVRDKDGKIVRISDHGDTEGTDESIIHLQVDRRSQSSDLEALQHGLEEVIEDVHDAVRDWRPMNERMKAIIDEIEPHPPAVDAETAAEVRAFLEWLLADNFVFFGARDYTLVSKNGDSELRVVPNSALGILKGDGKAKKSSETFAALPPALKALALEPRLLTFTKSNSRSTVHRPGYLDFVGIKTFDKDGKVTGERRVIGLLTSSAYSTSPQKIPLLRHKVRAVLDRAGLKQGGHGAKALKTIMERYPRDELFQISIDELFGHALGILRLGERHRTRLFVRTDPFARFVSCLIYVPRDNYNTEHRIRMQSVLMAAFNGSSAEFDVHFSESALARVLITVRVRDSEIPPFDVREIEERLARVSLRWEDELEHVLVEQFGEERGLELRRDYGDGFPAGYRDEYAARVAAHDIDKMERLKAGAELGMNLYLPLESPTGRLRFKLYHENEPVTLSQSLPMLEHMGVRPMEETPARIERRDGGEVWIHDFGLSFDGAEALDIHEVRPLFQDAFLRSWRGEIENDDFNRLTLLAGLGWREVSVLRAYAKHMRLGAFTYSQAYMEQTLAAYPEIARQLLELFRLRFDPAEEHHRVSRTTMLADKIEEALGHVANLDQDRILHQFLAMIQATLRTNFYQRDAAGNTKPYISFKLAPSKIPNLPQPLPMFEIFVYSPRIEGVHLRGGKVARGGLRWSDRMEDFRTEVLGLVKAQIVKNSVIVPVGSKGGFVLKKPPTEGGREALLAEAIECYRTFLRGLLDITDNLVQGTVVPPGDVVRHDEDDPYLVVAADKGTATFSDYANEVSAEYGFWLGDAFASGGSVGYDHKKMGITAKGAWESVKRHFRELGVDTQTEPFTVAGIGDMSGDVFGNGMLLSKQIRLIAAFDHRHIFIDPDPDPAKTWQERARLFELPRSSWEDYDKSLISKGGGIWPRTAKSIKLSPEMRAALDVDAEALPPADLIRAILKAPVDLLYNGGIGTYVKSTRETDAAVGDRANDAVRVNGADLRCRVIGEGGNLGFTQLGRIEFALNGGKVYTDAIDNSAGVDCSDHEVNIKILLNSVVEEGELTVKQRNKLLADMTDEVAQLVLRDNYAQSGILSFTRARGVTLLDAQADFMRRLAHAGRLNRKIEYLPMDEEIADRKAEHIGLVAPELAVLLAYSKIELYDEVLASDLPQDPYVATCVVRYFPVPLRERFAERIAQHALRSEIITTDVVNSMVNRVGATFVDRLRADVGASVTDVVRAYLLSRDVFDLESVWRDIEALDNLVAYEVQTQMLLDVDRVLQRATLWFLAHPDRLPDLQSTVSHFAPGVSALAPRLLDLVSPAYREQLDGIVAGYTEQGVPQALAERIAGLEELYAVLDLVEVAADTGRSEETVAGVYFALGGELDLHWLGHRIADLPADTRWQALARSALRADLSLLVRALASDALRLSPEADGAGDISAAWVKHNSVLIDRYRHLIGEVQASANIDMSMLSVLLRELRAFC